MSVSPTSPSSPQPGPSYSADHTEGGKRSCKRKHCDETIPTPEKRIRLEAPSSPSESPSTSYLFTPYAQHHAPGAVFTTRRITNDPRVAERKGLSREVQNLVNPLFMKRFQQDVCAAQQNLELIDRIAASMFQEQCDEVPQHEPKKNPHIFVVRPPKSPIRLDWNKLCLALSRLARANAKSLPATVGLEAATKATRFLKLLYQRKDFPALEPRYTSGHMFTHLCAQALAMQNIEVSPGTFYSSPQFNESCCFLSGLDLDECLETPGILDLYPAISFLRHKGTHNRKSTRRQIPTPIDISAADYPLFLPPETSSASSERDSS